jgi:serine/threonine-protein kinase HipA
MGVWGKNKHDLVDGIQRRHWNETAKRNAMGPSFETSIQNLLAAIPAVLEKVAAELPPGFPEKVSVPILEGIQAQAARLAAMPA